MRYQRIGLSVVVMGALGIGLTGVPAQAQLTTFCDGVAEGVPVPGDLVVAAGKSCDLTNVTIAGNAVVRADANLILDGSTVNGNLTVQANGYADTIGSEIAGATRLNAAYGLSSDGTEHGGTINARGSEFVYTVGSEHRAVTSSEGETYLESANVTGNVTTTGDVLTDLVDTVVQGRVTVSSAEEGSVICASEIDGSAAIDGSGGIIQIGAGQFPDCSYNVFGAGLSLTGNAAETVISGNVIRGDLTCIDNTVAPVGENNRVRGTSSGQCADLAATTAKATTITPAERKAEILSKIKSRASAGEEAAKDAGSAFG